MSDATPTPGPGAPEAGEQATRPPRPAILTLAQSVLALEAFAAIFAMVAVWGLTRGGYLDSPAWLTFGAFPLVAVLMMVAAARQKERWGRPLGWVLQAPLIVAGLVDPAIAIIGVLFLLMWVIALRLGARIDRERAEHHAQAAGAEDPARGETA